MFKEIDIKRLFGISFSAIIAGVISFYWGDKIGTSESFSSYITSIFSILGGVLFAVIAIISDPSMLLTSKIRIAWRGAKRRQRQLNRFNYLFLGYLVTLALMCVSDFVKDESITELHFVYKAYSFSAIFCFLLSFGVPFSLSAIQRARLEEELDKLSKAN